MEVEENNEKADDYPKTIDDYKALLAERDKVIQERDQEIEKLKRELLTLSQETNNNNTNANVAEEAKCMPVPGSASSTKPLSKSTTLKPAPGSKSGSLTKLGKAKSQPPKRKRGRPRKEEGTPPSKNKKRKPTVETEKMKEKWNSKIQELIEYKQQNGDCNVPFRYKNNLQLGYWVNKQRENYRVLKLNPPAEDDPSKPRISEERIAQLNALGFNWNVKEINDGTKVISLTEQAWNDRIEELIKYKQTFGTCMVPTNWKENQPLANFVSRVRRVAKAINYKPDTSEDNNNDKTDNNNNLEGAENEDTNNSNNNTSLSSKSESPSGSTSNDGNDTTQASDKKPSQWLTPERIDQLNNIGFVWSIRGNYADNWEENYAKLKAHKEKYGVCRISAKEDKALSVWILTQRYYYKNTMDEERSKVTKSKTLTAEKIIKLQRIGFEWEVKEKDNVEAWETRFRDLITFKAQHSHCQVPKIYKPNMKLSHWAYEQRKHYKSLHTGKGRGRGGLTDERIRRLEEIGFEWSIIDASKNNNASQEQEQEDDASSEEEMEPLQQQGYHHDQYSFAYPPSQHEQRYARHNRYY